MPTAPLSITDIARKKEQAQNSWVGWLVMLGFVTFWMGFVLLADGALLVGAIWQLSAYSMPTTSGTIVTSELEEGTDSDGDTTYKPAVKYKYTVGGQAYEGTRFRYGSISTGRATAQNRIQGFPVGKQVPVYYEAAHPDRAILIRGFEPTDLFIAQFLIPFNLIGIGLGWMTLGESWRKKAGRPPSNIRLTSDAESLRLAIYAITPLFGAGIAVLAVSFVLIFVTGFGQAWWLGWGLVSTCWLLILFSGGYTYRYLRQPSIVFSRDLITQRIAVQKWSKPTDAYSLEPGDVTGVELQSSEKRDNEGHVSYVHQLKLRATGRLPSLLPESTSLADSEWLKTTLEEFFQVGSPPAGM